MQFFCVVRESESVAPTLWWGHLMSWRALIRVHTCISVVWGVCVHMMSIADWLWAWGQRWFMSDHMGGGLVFYWMDVVRSRVMLPLFWGVAHVWVCILDGVSRHSSCACLVGIGLVRVDWSQLHSASGHIFVVLGQRWPWLGVWSDGGLL